MRGGRWGSDLEYLVLLPFAVLGTALMAADWLCQLAPVASQVLLRKLK